MLRVARGTTLYGHGSQVNDALYWIRYGAFKLLRADSRGQWHIAAFKLPGEILALDEIGLVWHCSEVQALLDSEVVVLNLGDLAHCGASMWELLEEAVTGARMWSHVMRVTTADQRLAVFLLSCSSRYAALGYSARSFRLPMTRRDLADFLGLTPESISRGLSRLRALGIANTNGNLIMVRDETRLWQLVGEDACARAFSGAVGQKVNLPQMRAQ